MEIIPNLHVIAGMIANQYLIVDDDGLTLIDAGIQRSGSRILKAIARLGYAPDDLRRIVVTHTDGDHVGGLAALKAASGAQVYASPFEADALEAGHPSRELNLPPLLGRLFGLIPWFQIQPVRVGVRVRDGQALPALGGLEVAETPGHTPGHISLFAPGPRLLFTGDSLICRGGRLETPGRTVTWDVPQLRASVRRQAALAPRIVCPGHGPVLRAAAGKFPAFRQD
jgi:glyoxylase-like metal-dependent hydrolase (beta-lactamase superfamily II)